MLPGWGILTPGGGLALGLAIALWPAPAHGGALGLVAMPSRGGLTTPSARAEWWDADALVNPGTNWAVTVLAPLAADSNASEVVARLFDPATAECVGVRSFAPNGVTQVKLTMVVRAESTPAGAVTAMWHAYGMSTGTVSGSWSSAQQLTDTDFSTDENWQATSTTLDVGDLGTTANTPVLIEVCRDATDGSDDLLSDAALLGLGVEWL